QAGDGVVGERRGDGGDAAAVALREHLLDGELRDENETCHVRGNETVKIIGGVVGECFGGEDARIIDEMVDGAELVDSGLCNFLRGGRLTDVSVDECKVG